MTSNEARMLETLLAITRECGITAEFQWRKEERWAMDVIERCYGTRDLAIERLAEHKEAENDD